MADVRKVIESNCEALLLAAKRAALAYAFELRIGARCIDVDDAEDVAQEAFLRLWRRSEPVGADPEAFIAGIAQKVVLERSKKSRHRRHPQQEDSWDPCAAREHPYVRFELEDHARHYLAKLKPLLTPAEGSLLDRCDRERVDPDEAGKYAQCLGLTPENARALLFRIREKGLKLLVSLSFDKRFWFAQEPTQARAAAYFSWSISEGMPCHTAYVAAQIVGVLATRLRGGFVSPAIAGACAQAMRRYMEEGYAAVRVGDRINPGTPAAARAIATARGKLEQQALGAALAAPHGRDPRAVERAVELLGVGTERLLPVVRFASAVSVHMTELFENGADDRLAELLVQQLFDLNWGDLSADVGLHLEPLGSLDFADNPQLQLRYRRFVQLVKRRQVTPG